MDSGNVCVIGEAVRGFRWRRRDERQLAREWRDGLRRVEAAGKQLWLVSLTSHGMLPAAILHQLEGADACLNRSRGQDGWRGELSQAPDSWVGGWRKDLLEALQMGWHLRWLRSSGAGFDVAGLDGLPWGRATRVPLETGRPVGFIQMVEALNALDYSRSTGWQPRLRSSST